MTEWTPPRGRRRWQVADGEAMVAALRASGETQVAFARRHGLHEIRVQRWVARVGGQPPRRAQPASGRRPGAAVAFAPVRVAPPVQVAPPSRARELEVVVGSAMVRVGPDVDDDLLRRVIAALTVARC